MKYKGISTAYIGDDLTIWIHTDRDTVVLSVEETVRLSREIAGVFEKHKGKTLSEHVEDLKFLEYLKEAKEEVSKWPEWKGNLLGGTS